MVERVNDVFDDVREPVECLEKLGWLRFAFRRREDGGAAKDYEYRDCKVTLPH